MLKANCPYCHHPSLEDISIEELSPTDPAYSDPINLKIDEVHHKIQQLDKTVEQLSKDRIDLLEELNEVQAPIGIVPQEILSRIFEFACSPPEFGNFYSKKKSRFTDDTWENDPSSVKKAQVLTKVSARWRRTVMATPQVWTCLALIRQKSAIERNIHYLRRFLEYSGHLPLTLSIRLSGIRFDARTLVHWSIDELLVKNLWRIKNLELNSPPRVWYSHLPQLTQLSYLLLKNLHRSPPEAPLNQVSSLSEFTLTGLPIMFYSPHITILNLHGVLPRAIFRILTSCPNLVKLYIMMSNPQMAHNEDGSHPVEPFTLPRLEVLEWTISNDDWEAALLNHLHLPSLQFLSLIERPHPLPGEFTESQEAVNSFFARLPTTLTSLELCGFWPTNVKVDNIDVLTLLNSHLPNHCQIESITLVECSRTLLTDIFQSLAHPQRLPRLSRITLDHRWYKKEYLSLALHAFLEAMEKRLLGICEKPFSLYLTGCGRYIGMEWFDCIRQEVEELKRRGCEVNIFFESRVVI